MDYLKNATSEVKKMLGGTVVHNPGVIPSEEIMNVGQDITIVVENTEEGYKMDEEAGAYSEGVDRAKSAAVLHTCTSDPNKLVRWKTQNMKEGPRIAINIYWLRQTLTICGNTIGRGARKVFRLCVRIRTQRQ